MRLVGTREIADAANVKRGTVAQWRKRHNDFPEPLQNLATGPVWDWTTVRIWLERTGRLDGPGPLKMKRKNGLQRAADRKFGG